MNVEKQHLVSVIVPVYNTKEYLIKCLESIINQTYTNLEIIIIDDGSNDGSYDICDKYLELDSRIKVIHNTNRGVSVTRNIGIDIATGKYILFIDSDDWVEKNYIEVLYNNIQNSDISICSYYTVTKRNVNIINDDKKIEKIDKIVGLKYLIGNEQYRGYLWNKLFKLDIIKNNNIKFKPDIYIYEDLLFVAEYINAADNITYIHQSLYYYRMRKSSSLNQEFTMKNMTKIKAFKMLESIYTKDKKELYEKYRYWYLKEALFLNMELSNNNQYEKELAEIKMIINNNYDFCIKNNQYNNSQKLNIFMYKKFPYIIKFLRNIKFNRTNYFN